MLKKFKNFLKKQQLLAPTDRCLLAVSGGIDSLVMVYLFEEAALDYGIAHCNFQLRGSESDADEGFVRQLALQLDRPFFTTRFDTEQLAQQHKQSIQMAARAARYTWLEQIRIQHQYHYLATAHHLDDQLETFLYNFAKGTGIRGLRGIPLKNGSIIRPLQFADKAMIQSFAEKQAIAFRSDPSNATDKYVRNQIRHHIIPELRKINPALSQSTQKTLAHLQDTEKLLDWAIASIQKEVMEETTSGWQIDIAKLQSFPAPNTILYELLRPFGFNSDQVQQIMAPHSLASGQQFLSNSHQLFLHRKVLLLEEQKESADHAYLIEAEQTTLHTQSGILTFEILDAPPSSFPSDPNWAFLDLNQIDFPLQLRHWKTGDYFQPLGMKGQHQKLKDFFVNQKLAVPEKHKIWILESGGQICWLVGHRLDERFKIKEHTQKILKVSWTKSN